MSKFGELIASDKLVLADFFATWCGPCKSLAPILETVSQRAKGKVKIAKIDVDKNQSLAAKLNVRGVPTLILYKNGIQVWRQSGVVPADQLLKLIDHYQ